MAKPIAGISIEQATASAQARAAKLVGRVLADRYRVDELAAVGGMAAVYRGEHVHTRKDVAIKVLHPETEGFPELVARFEREAIASSRINHPNVVSVIDFGRFDEGAFFLVLEYLEGQTLRDVMRDGPLQPLRAARIARQLAAGLGAAHQKGIIHRDVKPRNVMILPQRPVGDDEDAAPKSKRRPATSDFVKLLDFGFAKVPPELLQLGSEDDFSSRKSLTAAGVVFGTVAYMAPEAALGMRSLGPRADLYAVGIILYEMLAGKHPFDAQDANALFLQQRTVIPPPISIRAPDVQVPAPLEAIIRRLLEKDPDDRFEDAFMLIAALDAAMESMRGRSRMSAPPAAAGERGTWSPQLLGRKARSESKRGSRVPLVLGLVSVAVAIGAIALVAKGVVDPSRGAVSSGSASASPGAPPPSQTGASTRSESVILRRELARAAEDGDGPRGGRALLALVDADPSAFDDRTVREAAATIAAHLGATGGDTADQVFDALTKKLAATGLDVLYGVAHAGQATAATRANEILRRKDVLDRASPALRVALDLDQLPCDQKAAQFPRAGRDGDARALAALEKLRAPECNPRVGECCFRRDGNLERAIADLKGRSAAQRR